METVSGRTVGSASATARIVSRSDCRTTRSPDRRRSAARSDGWDFPEHCRSGLHRAPQVPFESSFVRLEALLRSDGSRELRVIGPDVE